MRQPTQFNRGDVVRDIYTGQVYTVQRSYWQDYAGGNTSDYTVEFEPTGWNKSQNLELVKG